MMGRLLGFVFCFLLFTAFSSVYSQNRQYENWYFGVNAGLNFLTSPPTVLTDGKTTEVNVTATISDDQGDLLFYTDGIRIWNRLHVIMDNGSGLNGEDGNYAQHVVIVPHPGAAHLYYVFYISRHNYPVHNHRLRYALVDMSKGDGLVVEKNIQLETDDLTVKISAVVKQGDSFWVVTQAEKGGKYYSFRGTRLGIETNPVISLSQHSPGNSFDYGDIKFSPFGNMIAVSNSASGVLLLAKFNFETGTMGEQILINARSPRSIEFSSDGRFLYATSASNCSINSIYQYMISVFQKTSIENSVVNLGTAGNIGMLQRGSDDRIYVGRRDPSGCNYYGYIGTVNLPNEKGVASNFVPQSIFLGGKATFQGLPNFPVTIEGCPDLYAGLPKEIQVCHDAEYTFDVGDNTNAFAWDDKSESPRRVVTTDGYYWLESKDGSCVDRDTVHVTFINYTHPQLRDTMICEGPSYRLDLTELIGASFHWPDGSSDPVYEVFDDSTVGLKVKMGSCEKDFNVNITFDHSDFSFPLDTVFLFGKPFKLTSPTADEVVWPDGSTDNSYWVTSPGAVSVKGIVNSCTRYDTVIVALRELFVPNVITPNDDGYNDFFILDFMREGEAWGVRFFDRHGKEVFNASDYANDWQGEGSSQLYYYWIVNDRWEVHLKGPVHVQAK